MATKTQDVLEAIRLEEEEKLKSILVEKNIELEFDLGNLLAWDANPIDEEELKANKEVYLKNLARDNMQLLVNEIWKLPIEQSEEVILAQLPPMTTVIPREKPVPAPRTSTLWEEFAKMKGIKKKPKRDKMVWDDITQSWRPRYGKDRKGDETKDWLIEVPDNADPYEDQFEKRREAKKERMARNEYQRLRNVARREGTKIPGAGDHLVTDNKKQSIEGLESSFHAAKAATASMGRFENKLKHEKTQKNAAKKRKFDDILMPRTAEKERQMNVLKNLLKKAPAINVDKAANRELQSTFSENVKSSKQSRSRRSKQGAKGKYKKK